MLYRFVYVQSASVFALTFSPPGHFYFLFIYFFTPFVSTAAIEEKTENKTLDFGRTSLGN